MKNIMKSNYRYIVKAFMAMAGVVGLPERLPAMIFWTESRCQAFLPKPITPLRPSWKPI